MNIQDFVYGVVENSKKKRDFVVPTNRLKMTDDARLRFRDDDILPMTKIAHSQLSETVGIPESYYNKLLASDTNLLAQNVNRWLPTFSHCRLVRTMDNTVRAVLSDRYKRIDHEDILTTLFPVITEENLIPVSAEITEKRLYLSLMSDKREDVKIGDIVQFGVIVRNSEVGMGAFSINPYVRRLICKNGMVLPFSLKAHHIGRRIEEFYQTDTIEAENHAILMKARDTLKFAISEQIVEMTMEKIKSSDKEISYEYAEKTIKDVTLNKAEQTTALENLVKSGALTKWSLVNAITATAHSVEDYDRKIEIEELGGKLLMAQ